MGVSILDRGFIQTNVESEYPFVSWDEDGSIILSWASDDSIFIQSYSAEMVALSPAVEVDTASLSSGFTEHLQRRDNSGDLLGSVVIDEDQDRILRLEGTQLIEFSKTSQDWSVLVNNVAFGWTKNARFDDRGYLVIESSPSSVGSLFVTTLDQSLKIRSERLKVPDVTTESYRSELKGEIGFVYTYLEPETNNLLGGIARVWGDRIITRVVDDPIRSSLSNQSDEVLSPQLATSIEFGDIFVWTEQVDDSFGIGWVKADSWWPPLIVPGNSLNLSGITIPSNIHILQPESDDQPIGSGWQEAVNHRVEDEYDNNFIFGEKLTAPTILTGVLGELTLEAGVYELTGIVSNAPGQTLTLKPGVILMDANADAELLIGGTLVSNGNENDPVIFDGFDTTLSNSDGSDIAFTVFRDAVTALDLKGDSSVTIRESVFSNNVNAIADEQGYQYFEVVDSTFTDNGSAFFGVRTQGAKIQSNVFSNTEKIFDGGYFFGDVVFESNVLDGMNFVIEAPTLGYGYGSVIFNSNHWVGIDQSRIGDFITDSNDIGTLDTISVAPSSYPLAESGASSHNSKTIGLLQSWFLGDAEAQILEGDVGYVQFDSNDNLLTLNSTSTFPTGFYAKNVATEGGIGTAELINIAGMGRYEGVYNLGGGIDTITLGTTDDAFFLDDQYTAYSDLLAINPTSPAFARLFAVENIRGGLGDDLIDVTSPYLDIDGLGLFGDLGNDILWGGSGDDYLSGGDGSDQLVGGGGSDVLSGGVGADSFKFTATAGNDTITDFNKNEDKLHFYFREGEAEETAVASIDNGIVTWDAVTVDLGDSSLTISDLNISYEMI